MVPLELVKTSNATLPQNLPRDIVAVFVGGTGGIGEASLKLLAKQSVRPRFYIVGRSRESAERIIAECRTINSDGEYTFIQKDLDLMKNHADLCDEIKSKETAINLLFMSAGSPDLSRSLTSEGLHRMLAAHIYGRILLIERLLPLVKAATGLGRVVSVDYGGYEGIVVPSDWPALTFSVFPFRFVGHCASMVTLTLKRIAQAAPDVSFIHVHPGVVPTKNIDGLPGVFRLIAKAITWMVSPFLAISIQESAERHVFLATSASYKPKSGDTNGVPLVKGLELHEGVNGECGSGVYSVKWHCDGPGEKVVQLLTEYEKNGTMEQAWQHIISELKRVEKSF